MTSHTNPLSRAICLQELHPSPLLQTTTRPRLRTARVNLPRRKENHGAKSCPSLLQIFRLASVLRQMYVPSCSRERLSRFFFTYNSFQEEKAQRKYERVQRNRHAAHMSRMRKQDEMENLRIENDRLRIDNTDLENEIKRLREELASRPNASSNKVFNSSIKTEAGSRPMTPPNSHQQSMLHSENSSPPQSMPSLTYSPSEPSLDLDAQQSLFTHIPASLDPSTINPADLKCSDDSRSAATCSLQWTPDTSTISAGSLKTRRSRRIQSREEDG